MNKVIVFDVDGTLFDTKNGIIQALNTVLYTFGKKRINLTDEDKWIGPPVRQSFKFIASMSDEQADEATNLYRKVYINQYISESVLYEGLIEVLTVLKSKGYHLCIATMKTKKQIDKLFSIFGVTEFFEIIQTADLQGNKTKSDMLCFIRKSYYDKQSFIMVGDTIGDYKAASENNYSFIYASYGYGIDKSIDSIITINSIKDIIKVLK